MLQLDCISTVVDGSIHHGVVGEELDLGAIGDAVGKIVDIDKEEERSKHAALRYTRAPFYQARVIIDPKIDSNFDPLKINYNF